MQPQADDHVDDDGGERDADHEPAVRGLRRVEAPDRFPHDPQRDDRERYRVGQRGDDRHPVVAVRHPMVRGFARHGQAIPAQTQRRHVGQVVSRIRQQREAVPEPSGRGFRKDKRERERHRPGHRRTGHLRGGVGTTVRMRVTRHMPSLFSRAQPVRPVAGFGVTRTLGRGGTRGLRRTESPRAATASDWLRARQESAPPPRGTGRRPENQPRTRASRERQRDQRLDAEARQRCKSGDDQHRIHDASASAGAHQDADRAHTVRELVDDDGQGHDPADGGARRGTLRRWRRRRAGCGRRYPRRPTVRP